MKLHTNHDNDSYSFRPLVITGQGDQRREIMPRDIERRTPSGLVAIIAVMIFTAAFTWQLAFFASDGIRGGMAMCIAAALGGIAVLTVSPKGGRA